jgi:putative membrane protein insertion efficiency factor
MIKKLLIAPIKFYKFFLSPWVGQSCRFTPTCSSYAIEAIETQGALRGTFLQQSDCVVVTHGPRVGMTLSVLSPPQPFCRQQKPGRPNPLGLSD